MTTSPLSRIRQWCRDEQMLSILLMGGLLLVSCVAGGASRANQPGQLAVRVAAIIVLMILCFTRRTWTVSDVRMPLVIVGGAALVALYQLVPLPPSMWQALPGREPFVAAMAAGDQPWRPINLTPDAGWNALLSLIVPLAMIAILAILTQARAMAVVRLLLAIVIVAALLGSLQLSGATFDNPFINETVGEAAGIFANRNHQALLLACGLPLLGLWAFRQRGRRERERMAAALALAVWFLFLILLTGSRAGLILAMAGLLAMGCLAFPRLRRLRPRWVLPAVAGAGLLAVGAIVLIGMSSGRALSLQRLFASADDHDIRSTALPLLRNMAIHYFPFGSGMGSFDPMFRIVEPRSLLAPTYFNHAHNDALEIAIEGGLPAIMLLVLVIFCWGRLAITAWRDLNGGPGTALFGMGDTIADLGV
ncbi:O-antigen ligase [Sphingomonas sp. SORGH_AS_0879]|uniref:O-antigen ligase family protein n=1 Tax=Sphingomonas sp. SORGH_AS_0879 TaxID=3041790 RepID=UPI002780F10A|nr:O-antigen ligase family protein [Sphingomonas sp. SORGH_AS_0879]MDQ1228588.1 O-antigen ligase [Sphingomonas sp. SORGH_AS_0879]